MSLHPRRRLESFGHALRGLRLLLVSQPNARIHAAVTVIVVVMGWAVGVGRSDWLWLLAAIALVWVAEALNTALELLADAASPDPHPLIGRVKDVAAGAVLIAAVAAAGIGLLVLVPHLFGS